MGKPHTDILKKTNKFLISRQFAVWSLVLLAVLLIIGGTLPDLSLLTEKESLQLEQSRPLLFWASSHLQTTQLTQSPLFLILPGAIWLSITLCTARRLRQRAPQLFNKSEEAGDLDRSETATVFINQSLAPTLEKITRVLLARRWKFEEVSENGAVSYLARKGARGFWGSVVFHLSMLVFLIGMGVSLLMRFDAEMVLAEGQSVLFDEEQMLRVGRKGILSPKLPGTMVTLKEFEAKFKQDKYPVDYAANLKVPGNFGTDLDKTVRVNQPVSLDKWQIFLHRYGFAPRFEIRKGDGSLLFNAFVNLVISQPGQKDYFDIPHEGLRLETQIFPDYEMVNEKAISLSGVPKNPVMRIRALAGGSLIGEKDIVLGDSAGFGDYRVGFAELRNWAWFGIVYDPGYWFIIIGFILCVAGLAFRFMVSEKWLRVRIGPREGGTIITLSGRSRYFPALFGKEIESVQRQLQDKLDTVEVCVERGNGQ
jgi:cytochrome c biogenesis protein ResB